MDETHDSKLKSWVNVEENSDFPIQNIPFGVYSPRQGGDLHVATAIGNFVLDLAYLDEAGFFEGTDIEGTEVFHEPTLNAFMSMGKKAWKDARLAISRILREDCGDLRDNKKLKSIALVSMDNITMETKAILFNFLLSLRSPQSSLNILLIANLASFHAFLPIDMNAFSVGSWNTSVPSISVPSKNPASSK
jgi:fumarylacetoacetase